jgi:hypothetical protein
MAVPKYRILSANTVEELESRINQLNGYRPINITNGPRLVLALMEYEGKEGSGFATVPIERG